MGTDREVAGFRIRFYGNFEDTHRVDDVSEPIGSKEQFVVPIGVKRMSSEWIAFDFEGSSVGNPNSEVGEFRRLYGTFFFPSKENFSSLVRFGARSDERPCAVRFFLKD